jgi:uncharacterized membrane protein YfcA
LSREAYISLLIGAAAGMLAGLTGVGGGVFLVPMLAGLLYLPQHFAHGTSFVIIFPIALVGTITYASLEHMDWQLILWLALGGVFGVLLGAKLMTMLPEKSLKWLFGVFALITGFVMIVTSHGIEAANGAAGGGINAWLAIATGFIAGIIAGMMGVGGGVVLVPGMVLLMGVGQHTAQGVSLAVITLVAFLGILSHYRLENVRFNVALWILPTAIAFSFLGSMVAHWTEAQTLRQLVGGLIIVVGAISLIRDLRARWLPT